MTALAIKKLVLRTHKCFESDAVIADHLKSSRLRGNRPRRGLALLLWLDWAARSDNFRNPGAYLIITSSSFIKVFLHHFHLTTDTWGREIFFSISCSSECCFIPGSCCWELSHRRMACPFKGVSDGSARWRPAHLCSVVSYSLAFVSQL